MNRSYDTSRRPANRVEAERAYGGFINDRDRFIAESERLHGDESRLPPPEVWRGRDEEHDFWGFDREHGEHPSLWTRVKGAFHGRGPKNYVRSDERIREDVCEHLLEHPYVDASDIEVIVRDGEVTLSGTVEARMVKRAAEDACDHVRGVKDVHNHLRVRRAGSESRTSQEPATK
jgi:hypothetical protein